MKHLLFFLALASVFRAVAQPVAFDLSGNLLSLGGPLTSAPSVTGPISRVARPGNAVSLSVAATGSGLSYHWFFKAAPISASTSDTLLIPHASPSHVGDYYVVVSNTGGSVTSAVARIELDSNRNGLGDTWETKHFGSLTNQVGNGDFDGDGVSNLQEFTDGTNPTNSTSLRPRLTIYTAGGDVLVSPNQESYATNTLVTLTPVPDSGLSFIGWTGAVTGTNSPATLPLLQNATVQANFGIPLAAALNTTNPVVMGGQGGWLGQTGVSHDGLSAAASGPPWAGDGSPFMEATVTMNRPGTAAFWWKLDGETDDYLYLLVNDSSDFSGLRILTGRTNWVSKTVYLPTGVSHLRWTLGRQGSASPEPDRPTRNAFVDQLVTTEYANPLLDTDHNGLPDLWEYQYFDQLGNQGSDDPDLDGISTAVELADGTDPSSSSSVVPRLSFTVEGMGTATASPASATYTYAQTVNYLATPALDWHFVAWVGSFGNNYLSYREVNTNNPVKDTLRWAKTFRTIFGLPPGLAADLPNQAWRTSPAHPWYGQSIVTHDGIHAAQSAVTTDDIVNTDSWLETTFTGPGTLSFFWKTSCATNGDQLSLLENGVDIIDPLMGITDWVPVVLDLTPGSHTLRWQFHRYFGYDAQAQNIAWLDQVQFTSGATRPQFISVPASLRSYTTSNLTFTVTARGTPTISYQVFKGGVALSTASTNPVLTIPNLTAALSGTWTVRAQNGVGSTDSAGIQVSILPPPPNDNFARAAVLPASPTPFNGYTYSATPEPGEPSGAFTPGASVWHRWTATSATPIQVTATISNAPSYFRLAVYKGTSLTGLTRIGYDEAFPGETNGVRIAAAVVSWKPSVGTTYDIVVDTAEYGADYQLSFAQVPAPPNDAFANRIPLTGTFLRISGDNTLATAEPGEPPIFSIPGFPQFSFLASNTLWWSWTAPATGPVQIVQQSDRTQAFISIFTGNSLASLVSVQNPFLGIALSNVVQGVTYSISADSFQSAPGHFTFLVLMDGLDLSVSSPTDTDPGSLTLSGPPEEPVVVQFSPNLKDWYFWSSNTIPYEGQLIISLKPSDISTPPAANRFFRAISP